MKKLYVIRHFIEASSIKEALRLSKDHTPDECYIDNDWFQKVGFVDHEKKDIKGF